MTLNETIESKAIIVKPQSTFLLTSLFDYNEKIISLPSSSLPVVIVDNTVQPRDNTIQINASLESVVSINIKFLDIDNHSDKRKTYDLIDDMEKWANKTMALLSRERDVIFGLFDNWSLINIFRFSAQNLSGVQVTADINIRETLDYCEDE